MNKSSYEIYKILDINGIIMMYLTQLYCSDAVDKSKYICNYKKVLRELKWNSQQNTIAYNLEINGFYKWIDMTGGQAAYDNEYDYENFKKIVLDYAKKK